MLGRVTTDTITPRTATHGNASIIILAIGTFAMGTDSFVLAGILPQIAGGLDVSQAAAGQVVTAFALTYAVAAPILAAATGRLPRKGLITVSLIAFVLANVAGAFAPNLGSLLVARVVTALAAAGFTPTAYAAAVALAGHERRGRALAVVNGGLAVGTVLGVPVGTAIGQRLGWQASLLFIALVALVALAALLVRLPALPKPPAVGLAERLRLFVQGRVLILVAVTTTATAGGILLYTYIAFVLRSVAHLRGTELVVTLLAWGIGGSVGAFGAGWLADRFGPNPTLATAIAVLALDQAALGFTSHFGLVLPLAFVAGGTGWAIATPVNHRLTGLSPDNPSLVISLNSSGVYLGQALGAVFGGVVMASTGSATAVCLVGAVIVAVALVVHLVSVRAVVPDRP